LNGVLRDLWANSCHRKMQLSFAGEMAGGMRCSEYRGMDQHAKDRVEYRNRASINFYSPEKERSSSSTSLHRACRCFTKVLKTQSRMHFSLLAGI
jgi:hypothetical protein